MRIIIFTPPAIPATVTGDMKHHNPKLRLSARKHGVPGQVKYSRRFARSQRKKMT